MNKGPTRSTWSARFSGIAWTMTAGLLLTACGGGSSAPPPPEPPPPPPTFSAIDVYVVHNGQTNVGKVDRLDQDLEVLSTFDAGNNRGIAVDLSDNLYVAGDINGPPGSLRVINRFDRRPDAAGYDAQTDREIAATGASSLRGIALAHRAGLLFAANFDGASIDIYGTAVGDGAMPVASMLLANAPADVAYDEPNDRLYVAVTDGTIEVIDDVVASGFSPVSTRTITPQGATSLHGVAYDPAGDRLVVTDVGTLGVNDDGRIFVIADASTVSGPRDPMLAIEGTATGLGDPVDVVLYGNEARVADFANDLILAYEDIFSGSGGDVAADLTVESIKPQALALGPATAGSGMLPDVTDLDDASMFTPSAIASVSNPSSAGVAQDLLRFAPALDQVQASLVSGVALENIVFSQTGDAYLTFDDGNDQNGGIYILNRAAIGRDGETASEARDRIIQGPNTGLVSPKGIEFAEVLGLVMVAENSAAVSAVRVFGAEASGDTAPLFAAELTEQPWDLDYDPEADRLFVAMTDGSVSVFDAFVATEGANGPDRVITPRYQTSAGTALASNLHGIVHVGGATDMLIVSDIGSSSLTTDGKVFLLSDASTADGVIDVAAQINDGNDALAGATSLGNPVDLAFDGVHLYVAEKSQDALLRFDDVLNTTGGDVAPAASITLNAVESVAIIPDYLARPLSMD